MGLGWELQVFSSTKLVVLVSFELSIMNNTAFGSSKAFKKYIANKYMVRSLCKITCGQKNKFSKELGERLRKKGNLSRSFMSVVHDQRSWPKSTKRCQMVAICKLVIEDGSKKVFSPGRYLVGGR